MPARKPPFRYYVVLVESNSKTAKFKSAVVKKSREDVPGSIFSQGLREYALDFQKLHNKKLRNSRKRTATLVSKAHSALQRAAPAFKEYATKTLVVGAEKGRTAVLEGVV